MDRRSLGRTGLRVSALALGTVELGMDYGLRVPGAHGRPAAADAVRIIHAALDRGVNLIDTAPIYGAAEALLGRALEGRRDQVVLATKVLPQTADGGALQGEALARHMRESLDSSLHLLRTDHVDLWQIHQVDDALLAQADTVAEAFAAAKRAGKARCVGASTYGVDPPLKALASDLFDTLQVGYSVLDQRQADRCFSLAAQKGVGIIARSVLLQGVLTERGDYLPDPLTQLRKRSQQFRRLVADALPDWTPAQVALAFALNQSPIGSVLIGVRTVEELEENLRAAEKPLTTTALDSLRDLRLDDADQLDPRWWEQFLGDADLTDGDSP